MLQPKIVKSKSPLNGWWRALAKSKKITRPIETAVEVALEERAATLASPDAWLLELFGAPPAASGVNVPAVQRHARHARQSLHGGHRRGGGRPSPQFTSGALTTPRTKAKDHPAYVLLNNQRTTGPRLQRCAKR